MHLLFIGKTVSEKKSFGFIQQNDYGKSIRKSTAQISFGRIKKYKKWLKR
jgi:hypothetical protein